MPNYSITRIAWPGTYNIINKFNQITIITTCTRHQASLSLYPPLSPALNQELLPPCLFQFWALSLFRFPLFITAHLFTSSALSRILRYCHNVRTRFLHVWRNGAFSSVHSPHLNITGLGVPHILHNRATESRVAGFTFRRNTSSTAFFTNLSYISWCHQNLSFHDPYSSSCGSHRTASHAHSHPTEKSYRYQEWNFGLPLLVQKVLKSRIKLCSATPPHELTHMASWVSSSEASQELWDRSRVLVVSMENSQDFPWRRGYFCSILSS